MNDTCVLSVAYGIKESKQQENLNTLMSNARASRNLSEDTIHPAPAQMNPLETNP